jgi:hypothetical protein
MRGRKRKKPAAACAKATNRQGAVDTDNIHPNEPKNITEAVEHFELADCQCRDVPVEKRSEDQPPRDVIAIERSAARHKAENGYRVVPQDNGREGLNTRQSEEQLSRVFDQDCAEYLRHSGIDVDDDALINCPYREGSDSEGFHVSGPLWHDFAHGEGGNVYQLALRMHGDDRPAAIRSLCEAAGAPYTPRQLSDTMSNRVLAEAALAKVAVAFAISGNTPAAIRKYVSARGIPDEIAAENLAYIPSLAELQTVLTDEEIDLTGLALGCAKGKPRYIGKLILWYRIGGWPVYYCARDIDGKNFYKAPRRVLKHLRHPIFNRDDLYRNRNVVWGEGFFDCLSLMSLGYGVAGEITCHLIKAHRQDLLKALRWRTKNHPEWSFTICLDNDAPTSSGARPGNEAAEKIARWLWGEGIDVRWVRHEDARQKSDINDLHVAGRSADIHSLLGDARHLSEIFTTSTPEGQQLLLRALNIGDYQAAAKALGRLVDDSPDEITAVLKKLTRVLIPWDNVYERIEKMILDGSVVYVFYSPPPSHGRHYRVFKRTDLAANLVNNQRNKNALVGSASLLIPSKRPTWRVTRSDLEDGHEFNLFQPSPLLFTPKSNRRTELPPNFSVLLRNLAGERELRWLLNHLAVYFQTLEKPRCIPVQLSIQGSGKNTLMEVFAACVEINGFVAVTNATIESSFNEWLQHSVILLDEITTSNFDTRKQKNKLKTLINESQYINEKNIPRYQVRLNNYIAMAANPDCGTPLLIDNDDRRYSIICGGENRNLQEVSEFVYDELQNEIPAFAQFLADYPVDLDAANTPLENAAKKKLREIGQEFVVQVVKEFIDEHRADAKHSVTATKLRAAIDATKRRRVSLTLSNLKQIMEILGEPQVRIHNQDGYRGISLESSGFELTPPNTPQLPHISLNPPSQRVHCEHFGEYGEKGDPPISN